MVLFGRAGEPVRPYLIARREGVSFSSQVAAWLVERILDLLMVLLIFGIALTQISRSGIQPGPAHRIGAAGRRVLAGVTGRYVSGAAARAAAFPGKRPDPADGSPPRSCRTGATECLAIPARLRRRDAIHPAPVLRRLLVLYTVIEWLVIAGSFFCVFRAFPATPECVLRM